MLIYAYPSETVSRPLGLPFPYSGSECPRVRVHLSRHYHPLSPTSLSFESFKDRLPVIPHSTFSPPALLIPLPSAKLLLLSQLVSSPRRDSLRSPTPESRRSENFQLTEKRSSPVTGPILRLLLPTHPKVVCPHFLLFSCSLNNSPSSCPGSDTSLLCSHTSPVSVPFLSP